MERKEGDPLPLEFGPVELEAEGLEQLVVSGKEQKQVYLVLVPSGEAEVGVGVVEEVEQLQVSEVSMGTACHIVLCTLWQISLGI